MDKLGILEKSRDSVVGRYLRRTDPFPGKDLDLRKLRRMGVTIVGRLTGVSGRRTSFVGGEEAEIDVVVWATGYRDRTDWVAIPPAKDADGSFIEQRGISPVPGLGFVGRSWQSTRGSALLAGVGADAGYVAQYVSRAGGASPGGGYSGSVSLDPADGESSLLVADAVSAV
jgi:putative flavoprotein involved in K+ transport